MNKSKPILLFIIVFILLPGCTRVYEHDFAVEPIDSFSSSRELYSSIHEYLSSQGFPAKQVTTNRVSFQLATNEGKMLPTAPSDYLKLTLDESNHVSFKLVRISSGPDFTRKQLELTRKTLENRILERTGKQIRVSLIDAKPGP